MPRFIVINNRTGYIIGDTANIGGKIVAVDHPVEACRYIDEVRGARGKNYTQVARGDLTLNAAGYRVYRADEAGAELVPVVVDGQDTHVIEDVESQCPLVAMIRVMSA